MRIVRIAPLLVLLTLTLALTVPADASTSVRLTAGPGAAEARGEGELALRGALVGSVEAEGLVPQPYGSGRFYGVWFVRADTGDKAFLGVLSQRSSIIVSGRSGETRFAATRFTDGPNAGSPIRFGAPGANRIVVLVENAINGLSPSPVGANPALAGSF